MRALFVESLRYVAPAAAGLIVIAATCYVNDQQILRMGANEPQLWMAYDTAAALAASVGTSTVPQGPMVPIEASLAPYTVVYDAAGKPIGGSGYLHGELPTIPAGVFDVAHALGEDALTWQPEHGVRQAIVVVPVAGNGGGFVMAGRSLAYIERQEQLLTLRTAMGLLAALAAAVLAALAAAFLDRRRA